MCRQQISSEFLRGPWLRKWLKMWLLKIGSRCSCFPPDDVDAYPRSVSFSSQYVASSVSFLLQVAFSCSFLAEVKFKE